MSSETPAFSQASFRFLLKASRQKSQTWLQSQRKEYEKVLLAPLKNLAESLKRELQPVAPGYHFPQKGIGRLKRPSHRAKEYGSLYKDWMAYTASRPSESRFDHNPSLFFLIQPRDREDPVLIAGGLYMPSSRQLRAIREAIAADAKPFDRLFASKDFKKCFKKGFSDERVASRPPRGFDPAHPRMDWLKLQGYYVWRSYSVREFSSRNFPALVARDCKQILRLNRLLELAIQGKWAKESPKKARTAAPLLRRLEELENFRPPADY